MKYILYKLKCCFDCADKNIAVSHVINALICVLFVFAKIYVGQASLTQSFPSLWIVVYCCYIDPFLMLATQLTTPNTGSIGSFESGKLQQACHLCI